MADRAVGYDSGRQSLVANPVDYRPAPALAAAATTTAADTVDSTTTGAWTEASPADSGSHAVADATGFPSPAATTLAAELDSASREVVLTSVAGLPASGELLIAGSERVAYGFLDGTTAKDVTRGVGGTTVATHANGSTVNGTEQCLVEREVVLYHTLSGNTLGELTRPSPVAHDSGVLVAPLGTDLALTTAAGLPDRGLVRLGTGSSSEVVRYASISGNTLEGITRGAEESTPAAWASGAAAEGVAYPVITSRAYDLFMPNAQASDITAGAMVGWQGAAGGGVEELAEGEPLMGLARGGILENGWGPVRTGGVAAFSRSSSYSNDPNPGEPVFAVNGTTVKALADADDGDVAVGYCLRTHDVDGTGAALTNPLVDFVMVTQLAAPYTYVAP